MLYCIVLFTFPSLPWKEPETGVLFHVEISVNSQYGTSTISTWRAR